MARVPQFTQGVFSQKWWRQVHDIDDCVVLADISCVHGVTPWAPLPGTTAFRAAAGNPDDLTAPDGLSLAQSVKAINALWPKLKVEKIVGGAWAPFIAKVKAGRCASVCVFSTSMATRNGKPVRHRVAVYWNGKILRLVNPIRNPHKIGTEISEAALRKAMVDYPDPGDVYAIVFPTVDEAFLTHPLLAGVVKAAVDKAVATGVTATTLKASLASAKSIAADASSRIGAL